MKGEARPVLHASIRHNRFHNVQGELLYCVGFDVNDLTVDAVSGTNILVAFGDDQSKIDGRPTDGRPDADLPSELKAARSPRSPTTARVTS